MKSPQMLLVAIPLLTLLSACAVPGEARKDARLVAAYVQSVQKDAQEFAGFRDALTKARIRTINYTELSALRAEQSVQGDLLVMQLTGDSGRKALYDGIKSATDLSAKQRAEMEQKQAEQQKELESAKSQVSFKLDKLGATASSLAQLAEEPSLQSEIEFLANFVKQVRSDIEKLLADANKQSSSATADANTKALPNQQSN